MAANKARVISELSNGTIEENSFSDFLAAHELLFKEFASMRENLEKKGAEMMEALDALRQQMVKIRKTSDASMEKQNPPESRSIVDEIIGEWRSEEIGECLKYERRHGSILEFWRSDDDEVYPELPDYEMSIPEALEDDHLKKKDDGDTVDLFLENGKLHEAFFGERGIVYEHIYRKVK